MSSYTYLLITFFHRDALGLAKIAVAVPRENVPEDYLEHWAEADNRAWLGRILPDGLGELGPVVAVEEILEVVHPR